jgi:hypothetical protein
MSSDRVLERPLSPTPESEVARILSFEIPPKRNSVVNLPPGCYEPDAASAASQSTITAAAAMADDACRFRPISPPPAVPCSRPLSPSPCLERSPSPVPAPNRPLSPTPPEDQLTTDSDESPPPLPKSMPPLWPQQPRPSSTPSFTVLRVRQVPRSRPLSAPGIQTNRPLSPPAAPVNKDSRLVNYRPFQTLREEEDEEKGVARPERRLRRWRLQTRRTRVEPLMQVIYSSSIVE